MKWLFLIALLSVGVASAEMVLEDPAGDVASTLSTWNEPVDLRSLEIVEEKDEILFKLTIEDVEGSQEIPQFTNVNYRTEMKYGDVSWTLVLRKSVDLDMQVRWFGSLFNQDAQFGFGRSVSTAADGNTVTMTVPRGALMDENQQQLFRGRTLDDIKVSSSSRQINIGDVRPTSASDFMPDDKIGIQWQAALGPKQVGDSFLYSNMPFRASNGEATTFAYEVSLLSTEDAPMTLRIDNVPDGWNIILPEEEISGSDTTVPVLAQIPFRHLHGVTETFSLIAERGEDYTELQLGVHFLDPAEISGHHDTAYIHSAYGGETSINDVVKLEHSYGFFSTDEDDEQATGQTIYPDQGSITCEGGTYACERFWLYTPLFNGFDANVDEMGTMQVHVNFPMTAVESKAMIEITHGSAHDGFTEELVFQGESELTGQVSGDVTYEIPLETLPYADRIDLARFQFLEIEVEIMYQSVNQPANIGDETPLRVGITGGFMQLPLNDYHDDVTAYFDGIPSLQLHVPEEIKTVNDGETRLFPVHLQNIGTTELELHLELIGEEATLAADEIMKVAPGEMVEIFVAISPEGTRNGDQTDAVLTIHGEDTQEIVTLRAITTDQDVPDDAEAAAELEEQETPWPVLLTVLALVGTTQLRRKS